MIVAGVGLRRAARSETLLAMIRALPLWPDALAAPHDKVALPALAGLACETGLPLHGVPLTCLQAQAGATLSPRQPARYGRYSVAETAALAAAGAGARLYVTRLTAGDGMATLALAVSADFAGEGASR